MAAISREDKALIGFWITAALKYHLGLDILERIAMQQEHAIAMGKLGIKKAGFFSTPPRGVEMTPQAGTLTRIVEALAELKEVNYDHFACLIVQRWPVKVFEPAEFAANLNIHRATFYRRVEYGEKWIAERIGWEHEA